MRIQGSCHCGNIAFDLIWPEEVDAIAARACDCSFCTRHGGVWTSHPRAKLTVCIETETDVSRYAFGTKTASFHVCRRCGVVPYVTSELEGRTYAVVNVNTLVGVDRARLQPASASFGGEDVSARLARRSLNWIAEVRHTPPNCGGSR